MLTSFLVANAEVCIHPFCQWTVKKLYELLHLFLFSYSYTPFISVDPRISQSWFDWLTKVYKPFIHSDIQ